LNREKVDRLKTVREKLKKFERVGMHSLEV